MNRTNIEKDFTKTIQDYLSKGYYIHMNTMSGCQGEIAKVDLTNGKEVIRIFLDSNYKWDDELHYSFDSIVLTIGRCTDKLYNSRLDTIWNQNLDIISQTIYYEIGSDHKYYGTKEEAIKAKEIHRKRMRSWGIDYCNRRTEYTDNKRKTVVLSFVKKQYKCKSATLKDIEKVVKDFDVITKKPYYYVTVRGRSYRIGGIKK